MKLLEPGIYPNTSSGNYHALPYVNNTYLKRLAKCPANAKIIDQNDKKDLLFGRGAHTITLEGDNSFNSEFVVVPEDAPKRPTDRQIFAKKPSTETLHAIDWWGQFETLAAGKTIISRDDYIDIIGIRDSVNNHPFAKLLLADGVSETTVIFDIDVLGEKVRCKCRPDRTPSLEMGVLLDLKTTIDAGEGFLRQALKYGYIQQAAFYVDGFNRAMEITGQEMRMDAFAFIAVEKTKPYRVEVWEVENDFLMWGRSEYERLLKIEVECRRAGHWPNYQNAGADYLIKPAYIS